MQSRLRELVIPREVQLLERGRRVEDGDVRMWDVAVGLGATRLVLYLLSRNRRILTFQIAREVAVSVTHQISEVVCH